VIDDGSRAPINLSECLAAAALDRSRCA